MLNEELFEVVDYDDLVELEYLFGCKSYEQEEINQALEWAVSNGNLEIATYLLNNGAEVLTNKNILLKVAKDKNYKEILALLQKETLMQKNQCENYLLDCEMSL